MKCYRNSSVWLCCCLIVCTQHCVHADSLVIFISIVSLNLVCPLFRCECRYGAAIIYSFFGNKKEMAIRLGMPLAAVCERVSKTELPKVCFGARVFILLFIVWLAVTVSIFAIHAIFGRREAGHALADPRCVHGRCE
jgi:hypothetical protein